MKNIVLLILFSTLATSLVAQEKQLQFGLKSGLNMSILSASINSESSFKAGFHIGAFLKTPSGFRPEIYFSSQGQKNNYITTPTGAAGGTTTTTINYLNIPLLLELGKKKVTFQVGPQFGFALSGNEQGTISGINVDVDLTDYLKPLDFSMVLGMGFNLSEKVSLGIRYNHGFSEIYDSPQNLPPGFEFPSIKNRVFHFYLAVLLNKWVLFKFFVV